MSEARNLSWYGYRHFISIRIRPIKFIRQMLCRHAWKLDTDLDQGPGPGSATSRCKKCGRLSIYQGDRVMRFVDWPYGQFFPWERI